MWRCLYFVVILSLRNRQVGQKSAGYPSRWLEPFLNDIICWWEHIFWEKKISGGEPWRQLQDWWALLTKILMSARAFNGSSGTLVLRKAKRVRRHWDLVAGAFLALGNLVRIELKWKLALFDSATTNIVNTSWWIIGHLKRWGILNDTFTTSTKKLRAIDSLESNVNPSFHSHYTIILLQKLIFSWKIVY